MSEFWVSNEKSDTVNHRVFNTGQLHLYILYILYHILCSCLAVKTLIRFFNSLYLYWIDFRLWGDCLYFFWFFYCVLYRLRGFSHHLSYHLQGWALSGLFILLWCRLSINYYGLGFRRESLGLFTACLVERVSHGRLHYLVTKLFYLFCNCHLRVISL
jgi:hypothetical protein